MQGSRAELWSRFQTHYSEFPDLRLGIDISRVAFPENYLREMEPRLQKAFIAMAELEKGAIANPDEKRMVGHYWLRKPSLAPTLTIRQEIEAMRAEVIDFA